MQLLAKSLVFLGVFSGDDGLHFTELVTHALSTVLSGDEGDDGPPGLDLDAAGS
jgi:hypothetical protein